MTSILSVLLILGGTSWSGDCVLHVDSDQTCGIAGFAFGCEDKSLLVEGARLEVQIYLDPSPKGLAEFSRQMIDRVLVPMRSPEAVLRENSWCLRSVLAEVSLGDATIVAEAIEKHATVYRQERKELGPRASQRVLDRFEDFERTTRNWAEELRSPGAPTHSLPLPAEYLLDQSEEARRVMALLRDKPTRLARLDAALTLPGENDVNCTIRGWAISEIARPRDPRQWDPVEVAHLVWIARQRHWYSLQNFESAPFDNRTDPLRALAPMGFGHLCELLGLEQCENIENMPSPHAHFAHEYIAYEADWKAMHPEDLHDKKTPLSAARYVHDRWLATDKAAPHPDMDAVRAELKRLEKKSKK